MCRYIVSSQAPQALKYLRLVGLLSLSTICLRRPQALLRGFSGYPTCVVVGAWNAKLRSMKALWQVESALAAALGKQRVETQDLGPSS